MSHCERTEPCRRPLAALATAPRVRTTECVLHRAIGGRTRARARTYATRLAPREQGGGPGRASGVVTTKICAGFQVVAVRPVRPRPVPSGVHRDNVPGRISLQPPAQAESTYCTKQPSYGPRCQAGRSDRAASTLSCKLLPTPQVLTKTGRNGRPGLREGFGVWLPLGSRSPWKLARVFSAPHSLPASDLAGARRLCFPLSFLFEVRDDRVNREPKVLYYFLTASSVQ